MNIYSHDKEESISNKLSRKWIFILGKELHFISYELDEI